MILYLALILLGVNSIIAQIIFLREFISVFYGNELCIGVFLSSWLLWVGIGSIVFGKFIEKYKDKLFLFSFSLFLNPFILILTFILIIELRVILSIPQGEIIGLTPSLLSSIIILSPFCLLTGFSYLCGCKAYLLKKEKVAISASYVYIFEALGSSFGGIILNLLFFKYFRFSNLLAAFCFIFLNFLILILLIYKKKYIKLKFLTFIFIIITILFFPFTNKFDLFLHKIKFPNFSVLAVKDSLYGHLTVLKYQNQFSLMENGLLFFSYPNILAAEEPVHFSMLQVENPRKVLLISGGLCNFINEVLKYKSVREIYYVELDPEVIKITKRYFPSYISGCLENQKVKLFNVDGRFFIKNTKEKFDVIISNLPDPYTAQLNRFYTQEFFKEVKNILNPDGVFSFSLHSGENYINPDLSKFLNCIYTTLKSIFEKVIAFPGNPCYFFASSKSTTLTYNPDILIERLRKNKIKTIYVREYYFPFRLTKERIKAFFDQLKQEKTIINSDFHPISYFYDIVLWSSYYSKSLKNLLLYLNNLGYSKYFLFQVLLLCFILAFQILRKSEHFAILFSISSTGFLEITLEILIILAFQCLFGFVYYKMGIIFACFMIGLSLGGYSSSPIEKNLRKYFLIVQWIISILPIFIYFSFLYLKKDEIFPILALITGFIAGFQFPLANKILVKEKLKEAGLIYGVDLLGSCLGALLCSFILIPIIGFLYTCIFLSILAIFSAFYLLVCYLPR